MRRTHTQHDSVSGGRRATQYLLRSLSDGKCSKPSSLSDVDDSHVDGDAHHLIASLSMHAHARSVMWKLSHYLLHPLSEDALRRRRKEPECRLLLCPMRRQTRRSRPSQFVCTAYSEWRTCSISRHCRHGVRTAAAVVGWRSVWQAGAAANCQRF